MITNSLNYAKTNAFSSKRASQVIKLNKNIKDIV